MNHPYVLASDGVARFFYSLASAAFGIYDILVAGLPVWMLLATIAIAYATWRQDDRDHTREAKAKALRAEALKVYSWMFAQEAVEQFKRWTEYVEQIRVKGEVSWSQPYEWVTIDVINDFVRNGGDKHTVNAVYRVKHLNVIKAIDDLLACAESRGNDVQELRDEFGRAAAKAQPHYDERSERRKFTDDVIG